MIRILCHFFKTTLDWITLIQIDTFQDYQIRITSALNGTTNHNVGYQLCNEQQVEEPTRGHCKCCAYFETKHKNNINIHFHS